MATWPETPAVDHLSLVAFERDATRAVRHIFAAGYDQPEVARELLHKLVSMASDQLARVERHEREADDRAREERETAVPPVGA